MLCQYANRQEATGWGKQDLKIGGSREVIVDAKKKENFEKLWLKYFGGEELPLTFFYTDDEPAKAQVPKAPKGHRCIIGDLARARRGKSLAFTAQVVGCPGGKRYLGFTHELFPNFEYFLSCGIPGTLEGERYKKTPELALEAVKRQPMFTAPGKFITFKRWDLLEADDNPEVVVFFARPDVLSGLFTLANFDEAETDSVIAPMAAGCASMVQYPFAEKDAPRPRAVLGMFDVSARPSVQADILTFAVPMKKFFPMVDNMEEGFLVTDSWRKVRRRITKSRVPGVQE